MWPPSCRHSVLLCALCSCTTLTHFLVSVCACFTGLQMQGLDLNDDGEKKLVDGIFNSAIDCLSGEPLLVNSSCFMDL